MHMVVSMLIKGWPTHYVAVTCPHDWSPWCALILESCPLRHVLLHHVEINVSFRVIMGKIVLSYWLISHLSQRQVVVTVRCYSIDFANFVAVTGRTKCNQLDFMGQVVHTGKSCGCNKWQDKLLQSVA